MSTTLQKLAGVAAQVQYDDLPPEVVQYTKTLIIDGMGCLLGGIDSAPARIVRKTVDGYGGTPECTIVGSRQRTSCALAVLANGTALRYLDANDYYFGRDPGHPSGNIPVAFALAEKQRRSGKDIVAAIVAGYEIHVRLCDAAGEPSIWRRGWHHATNAQFSSAATAARLLGADVETIANAMAISVSHHNTLAQLQSGDVSMLKASAEAWIAKGGVEAALFAVNGLTGPLDVVEGKLGWQVAVAGKVDTDLLTSPFARPRIRDVCIKPYAAVAAAMGVIQAAIDLRKQHAFAATQIKSVLVHLPPYVMTTPSVDPNKRFPKTRETADHSYHYCAAVALMDGACGEAQFSDEKIFSADMRTLLAKVELEGLPELAERWPGAAGAGLTVTLNDGTRLSQIHNYPPGHPRNQLTESALLDKFYQLSGKFLSHQRASQVVDAIMAIEKYDDITGFMTLLNEGSD